MYRLNQIKLNINHSENDFKLKIAKTIKVSVDDIDWSTLIILHKSIDARDKSNILFVYNVAFDFVGDDILSSHVGASLRALEKYEPVKFSPFVVGDDILSSRVGADTIRPLVGASLRALEKYEPVKFSPFVVGDDILSSHVGADTIRPPVGASTASPKVLATNGIRPIVVGFGPAGIFASYIFALNGLKPIIIERGKALEDRIKDVDKFFETMELDEESNVCFGEGGAGAFSDGKLNTNNKDKTGIYHFILETFVKFGADERILYENMPHIGTDKLVDVIKNMRNEIIKLGGEIYYNTKLKFENGLAVLAPTGGRMVSAPTDGLVPTRDDRMLSPTVRNDTPVVLAIGNSSRDTFRELIENGFDLKPKPFAIGYRIAHKQSMIDEAQYGGSHSSPAHAKLGPATYKLTYDVGNGHSVYSFCMCPGGYIINSSNYKNMLSINGMSYNDRSGRYANSAIVETIAPEDILGSQKDAIKMIEFQEMIEKKAFELEKGFIPYVTSDGSDICIEEVFKGQAKYNEKLKTVFDDLGLKFNINDDIEKALQHFNKIIPGFFSDSQYIIAGVETRTSSPVKLDRDKNYMCNIPNFYPCGEGLGHGGGIISCAADGVKVAMKICEK